MQIVDGNSFLCRDKLLSPVLPQRLQQSIALRVVRLLLWDHQRFLDQPQHKIHHIVGSNAAPATDGLCRFQGPTGCKHDESREQQSLLRSEQLIAPIDGRAEGLLARERRAAAAREQPEALIKPSGQLVD